MTKNIFILSITLLFSAVCVNAQTAECFPIVRDSVITVSNDTDDLTESGNTKQAEGDNGTEQSPTASTAMLADSLAADSIQPLVWPQTMQVKLDEQIANSKLLKSSVCGIMVYDLTADSVIYRYNECQRLRPASTMKMITAVTALNTIGRDHLFRTRLGYTGTTEERVWHIAEQHATADTTYTDTIIKRSRVLNGNIIAKGGMDPMFSTSDLDEFADAVKALQIDTIYGNLILDISLKDTLKMGEGWCWDDDNPTLSPLLVNKKPQFAALFQKALAKRGIVFTGGVCNGRYSDKTILLAETSHSLYEILKRTMKNSDNTYAECIFYKVGSETSNTTGVSAKTARNAVNKIIRQIGKDPEEYYIADGSGLSLYNYVTPSLEVGFLRFAHKHPEIYNVLYERMPIAGIDGTLASRMKSTKAYRNVHAKTGTVTGISSLAGYCTASNGHLLCFSIINSGIKSAGLGRTFQDKVCATLCE